MSLTFELASAGEFGEQPSAPITGVPLDVSLDASYPAGGYPFNADAVAQQEWKAQNPIPNMTVVAEERLGYAFEYDRVNKKLKVLKGGAALGYLALAAPGLTIGSVSTSKVKQANTVTYLSAGVFKSQATQEIAFTAGPASNITANASTVQEILYLVSLNAAGAGTITPGVVATGAGNAQPPALPAGQTLIGTVRIAVAAGNSNFTAGTTALSAGQLTVTYTDQAVIPGLGNEVPAGTDLSAIGGATPARVTLVGR